MDYILGQHRAVGQPLPGDGAVHRHRDRAGKKDGQDGGPE